MAVVNAAVVLNRRKVCKHSDGLCGILVNRRNVYGEKQNKKPFQRAQLLLRCFSSARAILVVLPHYRLFDCGHLLSCSCGGALLADAHWGFLIEAKFSGDLPLWSIILEASPGLVGFCFAQLLWGIGSASLMKIKVLFRNPPQAYLHLGKGSIVYETSSGLSPWGNKGSKWLLLIKSLPYLVVQLEFNLTILEKNKHLTCGFKCLLARTNVSSSLDYLIDGERTLPLGCPPWVPSSLPFKLSSCKSKDGEVLIDEGVMAGQEIIPRYLVIIGQSMHTTTASPKGNEGSKLNYLSADSSRIHRVKKKRRKLEYIYLFKSFSERFCKWVFRRMVTLIVGIPSRPYPNFCAAPLVGFPSGTDLIRPKGLCIAATMSEDDLNPLSKWEVVPAMSYDQGPQGAPIIGTQFLAVLSQRKLMFLWTFGLEIPVITLSGGFRQRSAGSEGLYHDWPYITHSLWIIHLCPQECPDTGLDLYAMVFTNRHGTQKSWNGRSNLGTGVPGLKNTWDGHSIVGTGIPSPRRPWNSRSQLGTGVPSLKVIHKLLNNKENFMIGFALLKYRAEIGVYSRLTVLVGVRVGRFTRNRWRWLGLGLRLWIGVRKWFLGDLVNKGVVEEKKVEPERGGRSGGDGVLREMVAVIDSVLKAMEGEHVAAGWPSWLAVVAGEAIKGWYLPSWFHIGQGTYNNVYRARDLEPRKIVALKNEVKCYMEQLLRGLYHCHNCGVLHRDIKHTLNYLTFTSIYVLPFSAGLSSDCLGFIPCEDSGIVVVPTFIHI
ncbi:hypothetical protein Fmac_028867 [Flemingia macrophylla]|uniref:Protein kinase domain-containing protein n=1 Tax=Flemingia macrophylla TaxID=520843 RepID=A0ABD1L917_9FABA